MWEICPYMTDLGLSGSGGYIVVSRRSWEKLSENAREAILAAAPEIQKVAWAGGHWNNEAWRCAGQREGHDADGTGETRVGTYIRADQRGGHSSVVVRTGRR